MELAQFGVVDYTILAMVLVASLGIGFYHGKKSNKTADDFLLANRSLSPIPVAASLMASFVSTVSILGYSAEAYAYGIQMYWMLPGMVIGLLVTIHVIIPVFYGLHLKSVNEYVNLRFRSSLLKYMMLIVNVLLQVLLLGILLYAPMLALSVATPISPETCILVTGVVVTIYCSLGGMKAVVWTDLFQTIVLFFGVIWITVSSMSQAGGFTSALHIAYENGRLDAIDMKIGIHQRHTTINAFISGITNYLYLFGFHQASLQRITSQRSVKSAKGVMYATLVGMTLIMTVLFLGGIGLYAVYHGCDPLALGLIKKKDQIMAFYVMHHLGYMPGVPGVFVACLFSGTLSSISSILNAVPTMLWNDFLVELQYFQRASEKSKIIFIKLLTLGIGVAMIGLAFLASKTKGIVQAIITVKSIITGPMVGVFVMGIAMPLVGKKGAIAGLITSIVFMSWIGIGAKFYGDATPILPLHTHLCDNSTASLTVNVTTEMPVCTTIEYHPLWSLYNISYTYFCLIGILVCVIVGLLTTLATGREQLANVKPEHVIHCLGRRVGPREADTSAELDSFLKDACDSHNQHTRSGITLKTNDTSVKRT